MKEFKTSLFHRIVNKLYFFAWGIVTGLCIRILIVIFSNPELTRTQLLLKRPYTFSGLIVALVFVAWTGEKYIEFNKRK